jgi:hypothetical protein
MWAYARLTLATEFWQLPVATQFYYFCPLACHEYVQ